MKKLLLIGLSVLSMNAFSQSYLILGNGIGLTLDRAGFVYDLGHFIMPNSVKISGGQFFVSNDRMVTVDSGGYLYQKDEKFKKIKGKGLNYVIRDDNNLFTVDQMGFLFKYDKDKDSVFKRASAFGGNYFLVTNANKTVDLYTVNERGNYFKLRIPGLDSKRIQTFSGRYFRVGDRNRGTVYTVSRDGFVFAKPEFTIQRIVREGGNFFLDSTGKIFTVTEEGFLMLPVLPASLKIIDIDKVGANYILDKEGKMFVVDGRGNIIERTVQHDLLNARTLSN